MTKFDRTSSADTALCLSGGGYRAALFHLGAIRRLNEIGILSRLAIISSVSGGSILNGVLAASWNTLAPNSVGIFQRFDSEVAAPLRNFCTADIRTNLVLGHRLNPLNWLTLAKSHLSISGNILSKSYDGLFRGTPLRTIPYDLAVPRFVFCATSINSGACWHFHSGEEGRMGDFYTGYAPTDDITLSDAVAASSAFPLAFAPFELHPSKMMDVSRIDPWGTTRPISAKRKAVACKTFLLTDGGVYDNLGLEPLWPFSNAILSSDGGLPFESVASCPPFVVNRLQRVASIASEQVGAVRKRWLIEKFVAGSRRGALWAINTNVEDYQLPAAPTYGPEIRHLLSRIRTDLNSFSEGEMACLENHGYSLADAAIKSRAPQLLRNLVPDFRWPNPDWSTDDVAKDALQDSSSRRMARDTWRWLTGSHWRGN